MISTLILMCTVVVIMVGYWAWKYYGERDRADKLYDDLVQCEDECIELEEKNDILLRKVAKLETLNQVLKLELENGGHKK